MSTPSDPQHRCPLPDPGRDPRDGGSFTRGAGWTCPDGQCRRSYTLLGDGGTHPRLWGETRRAETAPTIATQVTHQISNADLLAWLAEHGLDPQHVVTATISLNGRTSGAYDGGGRGYEVNAWLDVEFYKLNAEGNRYADGGRAATGTASVPLGSFPPLTPVPRSR